MIFNANRRVRRPSLGQPRATDRENLLGRAWDTRPRRWNREDRAQLRCLATSNPTAAGGSTTRRTRPWPPSIWRRDFPHTDQLARSAQTFLDVYVDRDPAYPARETFARVERTGLETDLRKSFFGKNMLHNHEHALIMYLHGRALEGMPAKLLLRLPRRSRHSPPSPSPTGSTRQASPAP